MKRQIYKYLSLSLVLSSFICHADNPTSAVASKFTIRSQGTNAARRVMGTAGKTDLYEKDKYYWTVSLTPEWSQSFNEDKIAECLFGDSLCDDRILKIEGSRVLNRDANALLADYFYLPTDFKSELIVEPRIQNFILDLNLYIGLDNIMEGFYFWLQAPIVRSNWDLRMKERVINEGNNGHDAGYFTPSTLARSELLDRFTDYAGGMAPGDKVNNRIIQTVSFEGGLEPFSTLFTPLKCAKLCQNDQTKTELAEVRFAFGWNFLLDEDYHLGLNIQASVPTGNSVQPTFLFAPQVGNDHHWELGGALSGHYILWRSEDEEDNVGFYIDANITHLFKRNQRRCFDLCGKPLSRYMLAAKFTNDNLDDLQGNGVEASHVFTQAFSPVANLTTFDVDVKININADLVFWFNWTRGPWSYDLGYNLWARSCEKISFDCEQCDPFPKNTWALKGDSHMWGYLSGDDAAQNPNFRANDPFALSASMNSATINGGDNFGTKGVTQAQIIEGKKNPKIDKAQLATAVQGVDVQLNYAPGLANPLQAAHQINTSIQPVFIKQEDVNFTRTKSITHKIFYHMNYTWREKETWVPYLGWGFDAEWAQTSDCNKDCSDNCDTSCNDKCKDSCDSDKTSGDCIRCGLSQWGVWAQLGVSYN